MTAVGIAVGLAACGRPDGIERCMRALEAQTELPASVIVVDQSPSDEARAAVSACTLPDVRYLEQSRLGLSASRNLALRSTTAEVLAVTDDDCVPDPSWLASLSRALARAPRPQAVTGPILPLGEQPPGTFAISLRESAVAVDHSGRMQPWGVGSGANFAAPVDVLTRSGGWDERLGVGSPGRAAEDAELLYRLLIEGAVVRYEPDALVRHEWQPRSRRLDTRYSYGYGVGALCGLRLAHRDAYAAGLLAGYARLHVRPLLGGIKRRDRDRIAQHGRALASLGPGLVYGLRASRRSASSAPTEAP